mmetsp:Transcript_64412/g.185068  ORF Transcript_64412/g.185068 Transcript_64412/m.185068 type:complete len:222 (-) Transcript_64412:1748-2413(-)
MVDTPHCFVNVFSPMGPGLSFPQQCEKPFRHFREVSCHALGLRLGVREKVLSHDGLNHILCILIACAPYFAHLVGHKRLPTPFAQGQLLHDQRQKNCQVNIQGGLVKLHMDRTRCLLFCATLDVLGRELNRPLATPIDIDQASLAGVTRDEDVVQMVEIKCLDAHERQVSESVQQTDQQDFDLHQGELVLQPPYLRCSGAQGLTGHQRRGVIVQELLQGIG